MERMVHAFYDLPINPNLQNPSRHEMELQELQELR